jgi:hypothetical protein
LLQQSALQINFPPHQPLFDTQSRRLDESQQQPLPPPQGFLDETGNLCVLQLDDENFDEASKQSISRHGTREKSRPPQKRRKKKRAKRQQQPAKKELGK